MKPILCLLTVIMASLMLYVPAQAQQFGDLRIEGAWIRQMPAVAPASAGFMTIHNQGNKDDRLIAVNADISQKIEIHNMIMEDGVMKMRPLADGIPIPAKGSITLAPGGKHIMFMGLKGAIAANSIIEIEMIFEQAGAITLTLPAKAFSQN